MTVDLLMTVMLPLQMAYSLIGETYHEAEGVILFALFITHHAMHRDWWRNLFKGRYDSYRIFNTAINIALSVIMLCLPLSGIAMSKRLFTFFPTAGLAAYARTVHLCLAYWGYILLCVHLGLHMDAMIKKKPNWLKYPVTVVSLYGVCAFIRRDIPLYLFLLPVVGTAARRPPRRTASRKRRRIRRRPGNCDCPGGRRKRRDAGSDQRRHSRRQNGSGQRPGGSTRVRGNAECAGGLFLPDR